MRLEKDTLELACVKQMPPVAKANQRFNFNDKSFYYNETTLA